MLPSTGIESISVDMKDKKLTVIGHVDPANIVCKLRKYGCAVILSVGPDPKEEERKKKEAEEKKKKEEAEKKKKEEAEKKKKEEEEYFVLPRTLEIIQKIEVRLEVHDDRGKQKAMRAVSSIPGIESISVDMKDKKLTVIGDVDPVDIICKLRKCGHAVILSVGPTKEAEEKKKKEAEEKKKKEEAEKKKKEEEAEKKRLAELAAAYKECYVPYCPPPYCPPGPPPYYRPISCEENPNSCVIM
ncbi:hypothetical protein C3L33_16072, partial [Rhododendron williamsianum]